MPGSCAFVLLSALCIQLQLWWQAGGVRINEAQLVRGDSGQIITVEDVATIDWRDQGQLGREDVHLCLLL